MSTARAVKLQVRPAIAQDVRGQSALPMTRGSQDHGHFFSAPAGTFGHDFSRVPVFAPTFFRFRFGGSPNNKQPQDADGPALDASMCGCQESLKFDLKVAKAFMEAYPKCGKKYPHEYADDIHQCARRELHKLGFRNGRMTGSSTVGGDIKIKKDPDKKCGSINDYITEQHELRHKAHEESVRKEHPDEDEAFEILSNGPAVAAEEAEDYRVESEQLASVIARLDSLCNTAAPDTTGGKK